MTGVLQLRAVRSVMRGRNLDADVTEGAEDVKHGSVSVRELKLSCRAKRSRFWATGTKAKTGGQKPVKDDRRGGHRPAQARHERGRLGGGRRGRAARSLTGARGESPRSLFQNAAVPSGIRIKADRPPHQRAEVGQ